MMGKCTPTYATAIYKENDTYYLFDPQSRNDSGMASFDAAATLSGHKSSKDLCLFIRHLFSSIFRTFDIQYQINALCVSDTTGIEDSDFESSSSSNFSGFEVVSEGEIRRARNRISHLLYGQGIDIDTWMMIDNNIEKWKWIFIPVE